MKKPVKYSPKVFAVKVGMCIIAACVTTYAYISKHNNLTELRRKIPLLQKEVRQIQAENNRLQYEIDRFESPLHLMQLARQPEFSHLKYPYNNEIIEVFIDERELR